jgi:hypothetical protein
MEIAHASLWLGRAESPAALEQWVEEIYPKEDEDDFPAYTIFWRGFGIQWFDHDFMQFSDFESTRDAGVILGYFFDEARTPTVKRDFAAALGEEWFEEVNAGILLWRYDYLTEVEQQIAEYEEAGVRMRFAVSVPYEASPRMFSTDQAYPREMR